jgi:peroxiredoxin
MFRIITCSLFVIFTIPHWICAQVLPETTLTHEGQEAPTFKYTPLGGKEVNSKKLQGKVVLVCFFTTNCGPCLDEMAPLEKDVWNKFKDKKFAMLAIGRGYESKELSEFAKQRKVSFPLVADPKQKIYSLFATMHVPRNYVINSEGNIVFQSVGYDADEFTEMIKAIELELETLK